MTSKPLLPSIINIMQSAAGARSGKVHNTCKIMQQHIVIAAVAREQFKKT
jgi:hypothetical protein